MGSGYTDFTKRIFRYRWRKAHGHVIVRVFTGVPEYTFAKVGELCLDPIDFEILQERCAASDDELVDETPKEVRQAIDATGAMVTIEDGAVVSVTPARGAYPPYPGDKLTVRK